MGRIARRHGYRPVVLTLLPALDRGSIDFDWLRWTDDVSRILVARGRSRRWRGVEVADLGSQFPLRDWQRLSSDTIHPTSEEARTRIAAFVSSLID